MKPTTINLVSPVASISLQIGSDVHHFVFTVYSILWLLLFFNCCLDALLLREKNYKFVLKVILTYFIFC